MYYHPSLLPCVVTVSLMVVCCNFTRVTIGIAPIVHLLILEQAKEMNVDVRII